jgi:hypothetical protein
LSLLAHFAIATGRCVAPRLGPTRTEADVAPHSAQTIDTDLEAVWVVVTDQWHTHQAETLVRRVAEREGLPDGLGLKGTSGGLPSLSSRAAFRSDPTPHIQFVSVPKHTSWRNQVEIWLGILVRRVMQRGSFTATDDLRAKILAFIDYVNRTAKPFRWTYTGRPLMA